MTKETSAILRLRDVVAALEKHGRHGEAEYYSTTYPLLISLIYGISEDEVIDMAIDDLAGLPDLPQKPLKYEEWDTFHFGRAAFVNKD